MFFLQSNPTSSIRLDEGTKTMRWENWLLRLTAQKLESGCSFFRPWRGESCWCWTRRRSTWGWELASLRRPPMELETGEVMQAARRLLHHRCQGWPEWRSCGRWGRCSEFYRAQTSSGWRDKRSFSTRKNFNTSLLFMKKPRKKWLVMKICLPLWGEEWPWQAFPEWTPREEFLGLLTDVRQMEEMTKRVHCNCTGDSQKVSRFRSKQFLASQSEAWSASAPGDRWKKYWNKIKISFVFLKFRNEEMGESDW